MAKFIKAKWAQIIYLGGKRRYFSAFCFMRTHLHVFVALLVGHWQTGNTFLLQGSGHKEAHQPLRATFKPQTFQIFLKTSHGAGASDIFEHTNTYLCDTCNAVLKPCFHTHTHSLGTSAISAHTSDTSISPMHASRAKVLFWGGIAYIYIYVYICIYIYIFMYTYVYIYMYTYIYIYIYLYVYIYIYTYVYIYIYICIHIYTYIYIYLHIIYKFDKYIYIFIYILYMYKYIYVYIYIYTRFNLHGGDVEDEHGIKWPWSWLGHDHGFGTILYKLMTCLFDWWLSFVTHTSTVDAKWAR